MIAYDITGVDEVAARLNHLQAEAGERMARVLSPFGANYEAALIKAGPVGKGPAKDRKRLYQNYKRAEKHDATSAEVRITNNAPYLGYVLKGRGPVVAKPGKWLRFEILGEVFFRKRVGPAAPNNFPPRVRQQMDGQIRALGPELRAAVVEGYSR